VNAIWTAIPWAVAAAALLAAALLWRQRARLHERLRRAEPAVFAALNARLGRIGGQDAHGRLAGVVPPRRHAVRDRHGAAADARHGLDRRPVPGDPRRKLPIAAALRDE